MTRRLPHLCLDCRSHGLCPWKSEGVRVTQCTEYHHAPVPAPTPSAPVPPAPLTPAPESRNVFSATFRRLLR
jgi:hypothetical protein